MCSLQQRQGPAWSLSRFLENLSLTIPLTYLILFCVCTNARGNDTVSTTSTKPRYFLTACAMIHNEMNVVLEWIEFHRIQGVDHFVFLDDESTDDIFLLPRLYSGLGYPDLVEVIPQNFRKRLIPKSSSFRDHDDGQMQGLNHCNNRLAGVTEWLLVSDVDEFMFSHKFHTIANFIRNQTSNETSQIGAKVIRFGSNGVQSENRVRLVLDPYMDQITLHTEMFNEHILLKSRNDKRGPFPGLDGDYQKKYNATCARGTKPDDCQHAIGKSIWRPDKCKLAGVHWCEKGLVGKKLDPPLDALRINHYAFRSKEHIRNQPKNQMGVIKTRVFDAFDKVWFSSVKDQSVDRYRVELLTMLDAIPSNIVFQTRIVNSEWKPSYRAGRKTFAEYFTNYVYYAVLYASFIGIIAWLLWISGVQLT